MSDYDIKSDELDEIIKKRLSPSRYIHTKNVQKLAIDMARMYDVDIEKISVAALLHDYCKNENEEDNNLKHAGMAADIAEKEYGIEDEDILNAIRYHTTGRRGMSTLELIIFLADTLEPGRSYPNITELRTIALSDIYKGALEVLYELKKYVSKNGYVESNDSIEAIKWLEERNKN